MTAANKPIPVGPGVKPKRPNTGVLSNVWLGKPREGLFPGLVTPLGPLRMRAYNAGSTVLADGEMVASFTCETQPDQEKYMTEHVRPAFRAAYARFQLMAGLNVDQLTLTTDADSTTFGVRISGPSATVLAYELAWPRVANAFQEALNKLRNPSGATDVQLVGTGFLLKDGTGRSPKSSLAWGKNRGSYHIPQVPRHGARAPRVRAQAFLAAAAETLADAAQEMFGGPRIARDHLLAFAADVLVSMGKVGVQISGSENDPNTTEDIRAALAEKRADGWSRGYASRMLIPDDFKNRPAKALELLKATLAFNITAVIVSERFGGWKMPIELHWEAGNHQLSGTKLDEVLKTGSHFGGADALWRASPTLTPMAGTMPFPMHMRADGTSNYVAPMRRDEYKLGHVELTKGEADILASDATTQEYWVDVDRDGRARVFPWNKAEYGDALIPLGQDEYVLGPDGKLKLVTDYPPFGGVLHVLHYLTDPVQRPAAGMFVEVSGAATLGSSWTLGTSRRPPAAGLADADAQKAVAGQPPPAPDLPPPPPKPESFSGDKEVPEPPPQQP